MISVKFGKTGLRGLKKCPKCSYYNGTRAESCKYKGCDMIFWKRVPVKDACQIISTNHFTLYSIYIKDRRTDCWGFVEYPEGGQNDFVLSEAIRCYFDSCIKTYRSLESSGHPTNILNCQHIQAAINCSREAESFTLRRSAVDSLHLSEKVKEAVWKLASSSQDPLVQRASKTAMVVKMAKCNKYNLRFTHSVFYTTKLRDTIKYKFSCFCYNYNYNARNNNSENTINMKSDSTQSEINPLVVINKKCIHYYACICAFASSPALRMEFKEYLDPYISDNTSLVIPTLTNSDINYLSSEMLQLIEFSDEILPSQILNENSLNQLEGQMIELKSESERLVELHSIDSDVSSKEIISTDVCLNMTGEQTKYTLPSDHNSIVSNICEISPLDMQITLADGDNLIDLPPAVDSNCGNDEIFSSNLEDQASTTTLEISMNSDMLEIITIDSKSDEILKRSGNWLMNDYDTQSGVESQEGDAIAVIVNPGGEANLCKQTLTKNIKKHFRKLNTTNCAAGMRRISKNVNDKQNKLRIALPLGKVKKKELKYSNGSVGTVNKKIPKTVINMDLGVCASKTAPSFTFTNWLSSVTECINEGMHFENVDNPDPLVFYIPQIFFDCLSERMSQDSTKKRLPNEIVTFWRTNSPPFGSFTKFSWLLTNIVQVTQIFETPEVPLESIQHFRRNPDGSYTKIMVNTSKLNNHYANALQHDAMTFLKVGRMSDEMPSTPFRIEWIPDLLPKSKTGQLSIQFYFGRKSIWTPETIVNIKLASNR